MAPKQSEYLLKTYKCLAQVPALIKARFANEKIIHSVWSERNLERGKVTKFQTSYVCTDGNQQSSFTALSPVDVTAQLLHAVSPCKQFEAIIREVDTKDQPVQYLEIWNENALIRSIDLNALELHAKVYTDDEFGSFKWCPSSSKLLYVAEKKMPKVDPLHKRLKPKKEGDQKDIAKDIIQCEEFKQDWGEALVGKITSILVIYDIETDEFTIPEGTPENICIAKPSWAPDGQSIIGICYYTEPRKLGLIYCSNRHSSLFTLTMEGSYAELSKLKNKSVKSPTVTPDGKHLIWLQGIAGGPHANCMQLYKASLPLSEESDIKLIVDFVPISKEINDGKLFYGLYNVMISDRCWTNDQRLLFSTFNKNAIASYVLDIVNGNLTALEFPEGSQLILDVCDDNVLINRRNFFQQDTLLQGKLPPSGLENTIGWKQISVAKHVESLKQQLYQYLDLSHRNTDEVNNFTAIYLGPKTAGNEEVPLIIFPHGGPHSASINALSLEISFLLTIGYAIVLVNYRGSIGAGQNALEYLPGKAGTADVADCILATTTVLKQFPCLNPKRVCLVGGSHGGFLVTHLSGQYPDMFRAVVARNPVVDIAMMSGASDIPDWCFFEAGFDYTQEGAIDEEILVAMRQKSPIVHAHKVKAATLLQIGTKDLRVPPSQGMDYYFKLKANNIPVSMNVYDDNHPLGQVPNEIGHVLSTAKWLDEHSN